MAERTLAFSPAVHLLGLNREMCAGAKKGVVWCSFRLEPIPFSYCNAKTIFAQNIVWRPRIPFVTQIRWAVTYHTSNQFATASRGQVENTVSPLMLHHVPTQIERPKNTASLRRFTETFVLTPRMGVLRFVHIRTPSHKPIWKHIKHDPCYVRVKCYAGTVMELK